MPATNQPRQIAKVFPLETYTATPGEKLPCPKCGKPDAVVSLHCACRECIAGYEARMKALEDRSRLEAVDRLWRSSGIAGEWRKKTFEAFDYRVQPEGFNACRQYAESFLDNQGESMLIFGKDYGVGKTHLAVAIGNYVLGNLLKSVIFTTGQDLMLRLRATYNGRGESEYDLLKAILAADLVIVDDVGKEKKSDYVESVYYQVINGRYVASRPMVLTTNTAWEDLGEHHIGYAAVSRLAEMCERLEMSGQDYRVTKRLGR